MCACIRSICLCSLSFVELMYLCIIICDIDHNKLWEIADLQGVYRKTLTKIPFSFFVHGYFSVSQVSLHWFFVPVLCLSFQVTLCWRAFVIVSVTLHQQLLYRGAIFRLNNWLLEFLIDYFCIYLRYHV